MLRAGAEGERSSLFQEFVRVFPLVEEMMLARKMVFVGHDLCIRLEC